MNNPITKKGTFKYAISDFWLSESTKRILEDYEPKEHAFYVRGMIKKAVEDFIRIINNGDGSVKVTYRTDGSETSYSSANAIECKSVCVQSDIFDLDVTVGLALHEAMHIRDTIFVTINPLFQSFLLKHDCSDLIIAHLVDAYIDFLHDEMMYDYAYIARKLTGQSMSYFDITNAVTAAITKHTNKVTLNSMFQSSGYVRMRNCYERINKLSNGKELLPKILKITGGILNWIEDRRIDHKASVIAPGYVGYYDALYDKYFFAPNMRDIVKNNITNVPTLKHYELYITNLWESQKYVNEVPALGDIVKAIDLPNIGRLEDTIDSLALTFEVMAIILEEMLSRKKKEEQEPAEKETKKDKLGESKDGKREENDSNDNTEIDNENSEDGPSKEDDDESEPSNKDNKFDTEIEEAGDDNVTADEFDENNEDAPEDNYEDAPEDNYEDNYEGNDESPDHTENDGSEVEHTDDDTSGTETAEDDITDAVVPDNDTENSNTTEGDNGDESNSAGSNGGNDLDSFPAEDNNIIDDEADKMLGEQKKFAEGDIERSDVNEMEEKIINATATGDVDLRVSKDGANRNVSYVCNNFNKQNVEMLSNMCECVSMWTTEDSREQQNILKALKYGEKLAQLITIRNEDRELVNPNQESGKVFKRHLYKIAGHNSKVFYSVLSENFEPVTMHISIDASGSMASGSSFSNAIFMAVALAVVADKTKNVEVVISFRGESSGKYRSAFTSGAEYSTKGKIPFMLIAYDSRVDKLSKIKQVFRYIHANSYTPEGLCFAAILEELIEYSKDSRSYFINISDGMPCFYEYAGQKALEHTRKQVDKMRKAGINIMAFFIGNEYGLSNFKYMYGKDATNIDVTNLRRLANNINQLLLKK